MIELDAKNELVVPGRLGFLGPRLVGRQDSDWAAWHRGFAAHADYSKNEPHAIVVCKCTGDVRKGLAWARRHGLSVRPRGGRHNYEGHSSCVKDGCIIDVRGLRKFRVDARLNRARLGAGLSMLELTEGLNRYGYSIPYATGASVGLAGFLLGGGFGINSRLWGLGSDHVLGFELIAANGDALWVDPKNDPALYFACLGSGGGNFGIVTEFEVRLQKSKSVGVVQADWQWEQFEMVVDAWQRKAPNSDWRLTNFMTLSAERTISLQGQLTGDNPSQGDIASIMEDIFSDCPPTNLETTVVSSTDASRMFLRVSPEAPLGWHNLVNSQLFKSTSAFVTTPLSMDALSLLREKIEAHPRLAAPAIERSMVQLLCGGGKVHEEPEYPTATSNRCAQFILQYNGYWSADEDREAVRGWVNEMRSSLLPWTSGAYINYVDDEIPEANRAEVYFGDDTPRLRTLKDRYDPDRVFSFPHGLP